MDRPANSFFIDLKASLGEEDRKPVYQRLIDRFKAAIDAVELTPGQLLPSTRELAELLTVSRSTAVRCYDDLAAQGFIVTVDGVGTFVRKLASNQNLDRECQKWPISSKARQILSTAASNIFVHDLPELNFGCAPAEMLPIKTWRQIQLKHAREWDLNSLDYGDSPFGYLPLRTALAEFLKRSRSMICKAEQVIVFPSSLYSIHLLAELLMDSQTRIAMGNPESPYARECFESAGAQIRFLDCDESGIRTEDLSRLDADQMPGLIYISPSHHNPGGAMLSLKRRQEILAMASKNNMLIIEDDWHCEYRYGSAILPAMQGMSQAENVLYTSNFWTTLFPLVNLGFMVIPNSLIPLFEHAWHVTYHTFHTHLPFLEQLALTEFIDGGHLEKHIRKVGQVYFARWRAMVQALQKELGSSIRVPKEGGGLSLYIGFDNEFSDQQIRKAAKSAKLPLVGADECYAEGTPELNYLISFASLDEDGIKAVVADFAMALKS